MHRDAFSYGGVVPNVDTRLIVDLRWFGKMTPDFNNCVSFASKEENKDTFGMPQPTFNVKMSQNDADRTHKMMEDMLIAAGSLGGFLPGAEPSFQEPGLALHITVRTQIYSQLECNWLIVAATILQKTSFINF